MEFRHLMCWHRNFDMSMPGCIDMQNVFLFLSVGLVAINLILMEFMQNTIEKEERIKIAVLTEQNQTNLLQIPYF